MFNFRYILLDPHSPHGEENVALLNRAYEVWVNTFNRVVASTGGDLNKDDFFRYDFIGILLCGDELVGSHCYSLFNLDLQCCRDHHFIKEIDASTIQYLVGSGQTLVYSLEYTQVCEDYRKNQGNIRWVDVLSGCALKFLDSSFAHGIIGTPRKDIKVDKTALRLGAREIQSSLRKMNYECSVIYFSKQLNRNFDDPVVEQYVQSLWRNHVDLSEHQVIKKRAA